MRSARIPFLLMDPCSLSQEAVTASAIASRELALGASRSWFSIAPIILVVCTCWTCCLSHCDEVLKSYVRMGIVSKQWSYEHSRELHLDYCTCSQTDGRVYGWEGSEKCHLVAQVEEHLPERRSPYVEPVMVPLADVRDIAVMKAEQSRNKKSKEVAS